MKALWLTRSSRCGAGLRRLDGGGSARRTSSGVGRDTIPVARALAAPLGANPDIPPPGGAAARGRAGEPAARAEASLAAAGLAEASLAEADFPEAGLAQAHSPRHHRASDATCTERDATGIEREPAGRAISQYAQARTVARQAVLGEAIIVPTEPQRASLGAGFDQYVTRMNIWTRPPWEFPATVGGIVPGWVQVYGVPSEIVAIYPTFAGSEFLVVGDDVVILEPGSRRIVAMLSRTSGAYVAERVAPPAAVSTTVSTTGLALAEERIRLSRGQIATIRTVLRQRECRYARPADFFIGSVVPSTAPFCDFPERVIAAVPDIEGYRFITRRNAVVVVDPADDRVVSVVR